MLHPYFRIGQKASDYIGNIWLIHDISKNLDKLDPKKEIQIIFDKDKKQKNVIYYFVFGLSQSYKEITCIFRTSCKSKFLGW